MDTLGERKCFDKCDVINMKQLQFHKKISGQLNEYHLGATGDKWLEKTIWQDKKEFYQTLFDRYDSQESQFHSLFNNLAYYNCTHEENIFIYEKLIWDLIKDHSIFAIINFQAALFLSFNDPPFDKIDWEYDIEYEATEDWKEMIFLDNGFVKAKTGWIKPPTPKWNNEEENKTALFQINNFGQFIRSIYTGVMDDCFSLSFLCLGPDKKENLLNVLQSPQRPTLEDILEANDLFVTLHLGADEGYQDYVLIKSKADIQKKINALTNQLNQSGQLYEAGLENVKSFDDLVKLIRESFGLNALQETAHF
jgi:hypothetical protein